jgi:hypothetical protein
MLRKPIPQNDLKQLYVIEHKSSVQIGKIYNVGADTVLRQLRLLGFNNFIREAGEQKIIIDRDILFNLYVTQRLSAPEIAIKYSCSNSTISNWIKRFGFGNLIRIGYPNGRKNPKVSGNLSPTKRLDIKEKMSKNHFDCRGDKNPNFGATWMKAEGNPNWLGGCTSTYPWYFNDELKNNIRKRDSYKCRECGIIEDEHIIIYREKLHIHHIDYNKMNCKENNLITLCLKCNVKANYNRDFWTNYFNNTMLTKEQYNVKPLVDSKI